MLKDLKKDPKKKVTATKVVDKKKTVDVAKDEEVEQNNDLVNINYDKKDEPVTKNIKKKEVAKFQERQIDVSSIPVEKKQEKKIIQSWVVSEDKLKGLLTKDFKMEEHQNDFESLTNESINNEIKQKKQKQAKEPKQNKVQEIGGLKFAVLEPTVQAKKKVDVNEPILTMGKKKVETFETGFIGAAQKTPIVFTNSKSEQIGNFAPLQKTPQQLKQEELEQKKRKQPEIVPKTKGWIGGKTSTGPIEEVPFKQSAWAAMSSTDTAPVHKFAPIQKSAQQMKFEQSSQRKQQEFVFVSKKEQQERKKARQQRQRQQKQKSEKVQAPKAV